MKNFLKRTVAVMIVFMCITSIPLNGGIGLELPDFDLGIKASAVTVEPSGMCGDNVSYIYNSSNGELVISGTGAMDDYDYHFNSHNSPFYKSDIKSVVIEDGVTKIGDYVFYDCTKLTSVTIPDSVIAIGEGGFNYCEGLTNVTIPDSVTSIGDYAFTDCINLTNVTIPDSVITIGEGAFNGCESFTSVTIPYSVTTIGDSAFDYCENLASITVDKANSNYSSEDGVLFDKNKKTLIQYPRANTRTSYTIPDSVTLIVDNAFYGCENLTSVTIPDSVTTLGEWTFSSCKGLKSVIIGNGVTTIGECVFDSCESLTSITIPDSVITIGKDAFGGCSSLTSITIPDSVTTIGENAFAGCKGLVSVTIPDSVTAVGDYAFYYCTGLTSVTIGNGVTTIGNNAFMSCKSLTDVTLGNSVITLGEHAFAWSTYLESIIIPESMTTIKDYAFHGCDYISDVYFIGTENQWKDINIGIYNENLTGASVHYNYDDTACKEHIYNETKLDASCTENGLITYTCSCGDTYTEVIPATGHINVTADSGKAPTKTEVGYTTGKYCNDCKTWIEGHVEIPKLEDHIHKYISVVTKEASCSEEGITTYTCTCGEKYTETIAKVSHEYVTEITKATFDSYGMYRNICKNCGYIFSGDAIISVDTPKLSATKYTYDGKTKKPTVSVKSTLGYPLIEGTDYTVKYESGRKSPGKYTVTITLIGNYEGEKVLEFDILPGKTSNITATQSASAIKLSWKKVTGATGYRIYQYNPKTKKYEKIKTTTEISYTIKNLKSGTEYKFAVKAYTKDNGETLWAASSKSIKTATEPAVPNIKITAGTKKATLKWSKVTGATGYVVYMKNSDGSYKKLGSTKSTSYTKNSLKSGKKYYFRVRAYKTVDGKNIYGGYKTYSVKVK